MGASQRSQDEQALNAIKVYSMNRRINGALQIIISRDQSAGRAIR